MTRPPVQPFAKGNVVALKSGVNSPRVVSIRSSLIRKEITDQMPWLNEPMYEFALRQLCVAEALQRLHSEWLLALMEAEGADAPPQGALQLATTLSNSARRWYVEMGLTPTSHERLRAIAGAAAITERSLVEQLADAAKERSVRADAEVKEQP